MNMKIYIIGLILSLAFLNFKCEKEEDLHKNIKFVNQTDKELYVQTSGSYPDTTFMNGEFPNPLLSDLNRISPNETNTMALAARYGFEEKFSYSYDTLMIFVFEAAVLESNPWETVQQEYKVLKRYDLSFEDLQTMNWTITFPIDN